MRKWLGIGGFDVVLHLALTGMLAGLASSFVAPQNQDPAVLAVFSLSLIVLAVRRHFGLRNLPIESTAEVDAARIDELEHRLADLEQTQFRVQEIEERLDFAERLLTQRADQALNAPPR